MLWPRWIFLRALGLIFLSAFWSLASEIQGLIGPRGLLPAGEYLEAVSRALSSLRAYWAAPTLLWLGSGRVALGALVWAGLAFSVLLTLNLWPRLACALCTVLFLSFVAAAQDFSGYQSDGMLLEAGFISIFFPPSSAGTCSTCRTGSTPRAWSWCSSSSSPWSGSPSLRGRCASPASSWSP